MSYTQFVQEVEELLNAVWLIKKKRDRRKAIERVLEMVEEWACEEEA